MRNTIRSMTAVEIEACRPLLDLRKGVQAPLAVLQREQDIINSSLSGLSAVMHGEYGEHLGIDLDTLTLYEDKEEEA